jgi:hypothetical protein
MIQFNLLPDIKIRYLRANRQKHTIVLASALVIVAALVTMGTLVTIVFVLQKKNIHDLSSDITTKSSELKSTKDLSKILTVQNQLQELQTLHDGKPVVTRLFSYLDTAKPAAATNTRTFADYTQHTISLSGTTDTLDTVQLYIDRLKQTTYHTDAAPNTEVPAFSAVTLASFGRDAKSASYTITLNFDPIIFSESSNVTFTIGKTASTQNVDTNSNGNGSQQ